MEDDKAKAPKIHMSDKTKNILEWIICILIAVILTLLFRYYIATPTVVKQVSMYPTLEENQRLIVSRTFRITGNMPERGDIVTFEAPSYIYSSSTIDQTNPVAIYSDEERGIVSGYQGSKPTEVVMSKERWEELKMGQGENGDGPNFPS